MKVVIDTNVVVSGLIKADGNPAQVLELALVGAVRVCYDERILAEYVDVLARRRFHFDPKRIREVLQQIQAGGLAVEASMHRDLQLPDADDEPFLAVALAASVECLVTGNISDYPPDKRRGCSVVTPAAFMEQWRKRAPVG
jgi:putative PIN family toxin of toxin-antitoxin system